MKFLKIFYREMRVVLPYELSGYAVLAWVLINTTLLTAAYYGASNRFPSGLGVIQLVNAAFVGSYSLLRAFAFHPVMRGEYLKWLMMQPWRRGMQLPCGPIFFCWQDAIVLGLCSLPVLIIGESPFLVFLMFAIPFIIGWTVINALTEQYIPAYLASLLLPTAVFFSENHWIVVDVVALSTAIAAWGVWRGLETFPWQFERKLSDKKRPPWWKLKGVEPDPLTIGWPQNVLLNELSWRWYGSRHAVLMSMLVVVWWMAVLTWYPLPKFGDSIPRGTMFLVILLAGTRLFAYCRVAFPPISLLGRLWTGRFIIPRYDYVFMAPILILVVGLNLPWILWQDVGLPLDWAISITLGVITWLTMALPPTLRTWQLTGHHRLKPGRRFATIFDTLEQRTNSRPRSRR